MKYMFILISAAFLVSCSSKDKAHTEGDSCASNCAHHNTSMDKHDCQACADANKTGGGCPECGDKSAAAAAAPAWTLSGNPQIKKEITQEEFNAFFTKNKEKLAKQCQTPAMKYCGKTEKDMDINEEHMTCLWTKVFRVTRETMPQLDGTPCAKTIKNFAKK